MFRSIFTTIFRGAREQSNLVTAQSTAHEPPEDGRTYGPKHVGATSLKCFKHDFKCFK
jgi:hypothetical protein